MRKSICIGLVNLLILAMIILIPTLAIADDGVFRSGGKWTSAGDFALHCHHASTRSMTIYADPDLTQPITTVPARTFFGTNSNAHSIETGEDGRDIRASGYLEYITYPAGERGAGWVETVSNGRQTLSSAYVESSNGKGTVHLLYVLLGVQYDVDVVVPDTDPVWGDLPSSASSKSSTETGSKKRSDTAASASRFTLMSEDGEQQVKVLTLGSTQSHVQGEVSPFDVDTALLCLDGVEISSRLAYIYAPRTGSCTLRAKASNSGKKVATCKAGTVVIVLEKDDTYTRIYDSGKEGYVLTSCLQFLESGNKPIGTGTVTVTGKKVRSNTTVRIRNQAAKNSAVVAKWLVGIKVEVYSHTNGWYEVEHYGVHGFIMEQYLQMDE